MRLFFLILLFAKFSHCDTNIKDVKAEAINEKIPLFLTENKKHTNNKKNENFFCNIAIAIDASSDILIQQYFNMELSLISNNLTTIFPYLKHIALTSYNANIEKSYGFNSFEDESAFSNAVNQITQSPGFNLYGALSQLNSLQTPDNGDLSTYVFISKNDPVQIQMSIDIAKKLKNKGSLNFIIIGTDLTLSNLRPLNVSNVVVFEFCDCEVEKVLRFFQATMICKKSNEISTTFQPSTTQKTTTSIPNTLNRNVIAIDSSSEVLYELLFKNEKDIMANNISFLINDFSRTALISYDKSVHPSYFGQVRSQTEFLQLLNTFTQHYGYRLNLLLKFIDKLEIPKNGELTTFIFVSKYDEEQVENSYNDAKKLRKKGTLKFIILGNEISPNLLTGLTDISNIFVYNFDEKDLKSLIKFFSKSLL